MKLSCFEGDVDGIEVGGDEGKIVCLLLGFSDGSSDDDDEDILVGDDVGTGNGLLDEEIEGLADG